MPGTTRELEQAFLSGLEYSTERSLVDWMEAIRDQPFSNKASIVKWLKEKYNFDHIDANLLAGIFLNDGKPVYGPMTR